MFVSYLFRIAFLSTAIVLTTCIKNPCKRGEATDNKKFFPHPEDETKFIQCSNFGQMFEFSCSTGLVWDQKLGSCQHGNPANPTVSKVIEPQAQIAPQTPKAPITPIAPIAPQTPKAPQAPIASQTPTVTHLETNVKSIAIFDSEICQNMEIKNSNSITINGLYSKAFDSKLFKRSDDPSKNPSLIGIVKGKWCITNSFATQSNINLKFVEENCGSNLECCLLSSEASDFIGLSDEKRLWTNSLGLNQPLDLSCKVSDTISQSVNSIHRPFKVDPHILSTDKESAAHESLQKKMLQHLLEDQLLLRVVFRPSQQKQSQ